MTRRAPLYALLAVAALVVACAGTTGGGLVAFDVAAAGPAGLTTRGAYAFDTPAGWRVALTRARLHVGAVYLRRVRPLEVVRATACVEPGDYVAQATAGRLVDLLDPAPQVFPAPGRGVADRALTAEVWLGAARIDEDTDPDVAFEVAGTATRAGAEVPFDGVVTFGANRAIPPRDPAQPGASPMCQQRIVTPIAVDLEPREGGALVVRVDPAGLLARVDFAALPKVRDEPPLSRFRDANEGQPDLALANALRAREGVYAFEWKDGGLR